MKDGEPTAEGVARIIPETSPFYPEDPSAWASGEVLRLLLVPIVVAMLFVGGIYWMKWRLPAGHAEQEPDSTVQVHLMARPGPELVPVPVAEASSATAASIAERAESSNDQSDRPAEDASVAPVPPATTTIAVTAPIDRTVPTDGPPSAAVTRFREALWRHVARYQHYPRAARRERLKGAVSTVLFSLRRDGTVLGVWVKSSSGQPIFDKEAVDAIWRAQPMPPLPSDLPEPFTVDMPLAFDPP